MGRQRANVFLEDSCGFIWIGGSRLQRFDGYKIMPFRLATNDSSNISIGTVYAMFEDSKKRIWVGASNGLFTYNKETNQCRRRYAKTSKNKDDYGVLSILEDSRGRIWFGDEAHLFVLEDPDSSPPRIIQGIDLELKGQYQIGITTILESSGMVIYAATRDGLWLVQPDFTAKQLLPDKWKNSKIEFQILHAVANTDGTFLLATSDGLWVFDPNGKSFSKIELPITVDLVILALKIGKENDLWLGIENYGLVLWKNGRLTHYTNDPDNPYSLVYNSVRTLLFDRFDNLWIGTQRGISKTNIGQQSFPFYQLDPGPRRLLNYTHRILQDSQGGFWIRAYDGDLIYSPGLESEFHILLGSGPNSISKKVKNFCVDPDGAIWVITLNNGLYKFEKGQKKPRLINLGDSLRLAYPSLILSDRIDHQYLWFSSEFGLCRINRFTYTRTWFHPKDDLPWVDDNLIGSMDQSEDGNIWFTTRIQGTRHIACFEKHREKFTAEPDRPGHPSSIKSTKTWQYKSVPGNKIWVGTNNGVIIIDAAKKTGKRLTRKEGFPLKTVLSITPDLKGNIWFTGDGKICKYDGSTYQCQTAWEGIENFTYWSGTLGKDGRVTFGGTNGFYSFYPNEIVFRKDTLAPKVYLTNFKVFNETHALEQAYELVKTISIPFKENVIEFEFSALHFLHADRIKYRHRLLGFEKKWVETGSDDRQVTYTNLLPGTYTFQVIAANADGIWTPENKSLQITLNILPPWYRTWWAYMIYLLAISGILLSLRRYELRRQLAKAEVRQLKELDTVKTRLYTNITHEFRTPLTIILGMTDQMENEPKAWFLKGVHMIRRNGQHLLHLINQMLDLSKIESGNMPLQMFNSDVVLYLRYIAESFHSFAESKNVDIHFLSAEITFAMDFDPEKLLNIVSNLLSNAVKYTPEGGNVYIQVQRIEHQESPFLEVKVRDTGIGIPDKDLERIFDRFYQVDSASTRRVEGSGIGLALTKELVKLLGGTIRVESQRTKGSTFTVLLPIRQEAPEFVQKEVLPLKAQVQPFVEEASLAEELEALPGNGRLPLLLIIEDNPDVVRYLVSCLHGTYQLITAANGQLGIDKAIELVPDVVISDVMMPQKDGFEVCQTLKKDVRTSHIPIILLTAKADMESKLEGLELGADAYLAKPFNREELTIRLKKLIELRRTLQDRYSKYPGSSIEDAGRNTIEDEFLSKIRQLIEENISDADYGLAQLCRALHMSRSQLFRKLKALTGQSTTIFIRSIRLYYARELLRTTDLTISEIAYEVGFTSPAYFTRVFTEVFGLAPSALR
ncbi:MAG: response regulator [Lewinellaceae bacterium]|nr:response regulator [Lewinellaceae bacterium]